MPSFDLLPCAALVTDPSGNIQSINQDLLRHSGGTNSDWLAKPMDALFSKASRMFLQTHVWPMLLRDGKIRELKLQLLGTDGEKFPVLVNCQRNTVDGEIRFTWVLFVSLERSRFEQELLDSRKRAETATQKLTESERFLRTVADNMPSMIAYWDSQLLCRFSNAAYVEWFGKTPQDMQGASMRSVLGDALFEANARQIQGALHGEPQEFEHIIQRPDGSERHTLANYIPDRDANGVVNGFFALVTNITRMWEADAAIRLSASVFEATTEGIMVTDAEAKIVSVNAAFQSLTGYSPNEVTGLNASVLKSDRHDESFFAALFSRLQTEKTWRGEVWNKRKDGSLYLVQLSISAITDEAGNVVRYVGVFSDITERWDKEQFMQQMALHDGLTGLPNRRLLLERLGQLIASAGREDRQISLMFLDLDGFKSVNDTWGHGMGDQVLKTVASRLLALLRASDTVVRLGGDEFVLLLDNPESHESLELIARRIIAEVNAPMVFDQGTVHVGTSIGIAVFPVDGATPDDLLKSADKAMYLAKESGKNAYCFATSPESPPHSDD